MSCSIDVAVLYMVNAAANIVTDVALFILPIPMVMQLHMSMAQKIGALVVFSIGTITVATSVGKLAVLWGRKPSANKYLTVRIYYLVDVQGTTDLPWDSAKANVWSLVEANLFIICASMPTLRRFFKHFAPKMMGSSTGDSRSHKYGPNGGSTLRTIGGTGGPSGISNMSRKARRDYEEFGDAELELFDRDAKHPNVRDTRVDATGAEDQAQPDSSSDKAILQTKTFEIRYDAWF
jgi:hypothetical protein